MQNDINNPKNKKAQETGTGNSPADDCISDSSPGFFYSPDSEMDRGWVKNFRKIKEWEWYKKPIMAHLFQHIIREANHKDKHWQGILIKRGQFITGRESLSADTGLSIQQVRTCLERLQKTSELTIKSTNKFSIITVCNYEKYQNPEENNNQQSNHQITIKQPSNNHQITTTKNVKNDKNEKNNIYPDWLDMNLWKEFKEHRIRLKAPMSQSAEKRNISKLEKLMSDNGTSQDDIIGQSIEFGWKGLFPIRGTKQNGREEIDRRIVEDIFGDMGPPERS